MANLRDLGREAGHADLDPEACIECGSPEMESIRRVLALADQIEEEGLDLWPWALAEAIRKAVAAPE